MFDAENFLTDITTWTPSIAEQIAKMEKVELTEAHWELIYLARQFHQRFGLSPSMRPLIKYAKTYAGLEKATSIYFLSLFPGNPAKLISKIGGLPKPDNCL